MSSWRAGRASGDEREGVREGRVSRGYLLVRVDGKAFGLPLARVLEVGDLAEVLDVPRALPAMRGLTQIGRASCRERGESSQAAGEVIEESNDIRARSTGC